MPDVTGMTETEAIAAIGLVPNISYGSSTTECSDTVAAGSVISQSATGTVTCGTVVNLVVSTGKPSVPDVTGMTETEAIAAIGLVPNISYGSSTTQCSDTVAAGSVISQSATGTVTCGTVVNLVVSTGKPSVPDVTGMTETEAIAAIGLVPNISYGSSTTQCSDTVAAGSVISQSATGTVTCGTVVNLVVSTGKPSVPDVTGMTETEAIAAIGLVPNISYGSSTTQCSDTVAAGSVISQSATGTVTCGTVVNLVVSTGKPSVPDVTNMTETEAIAAIGLVPNISYGSSTTQCSDTVAAGSVISQSATGTVTCGTVVNLVVSTGKPSVPDVTNMTETEAIAAIGLVPNISYGSSTTQCSDTVAAGYVISQSATGTVTCGTVVNLVVSTGKPSVPDVTNMTETEAIAAIGLVPNISYGSSTTQCSDTVAAGSVISQSATGTVTCGTVVNLVVSTGKPSVPDVTGMTETEAIAAIGLVPNISYGSSTTQCSDTVAAGSVISQSATGTVTCGTVVNLVVSTGKPSVPDVTNMTETEAIAAIGLVPNISYGSSTTQCSDTVAAGYVISQSATGTVTCGTVVNLVVSTGKPSVPDVTGMTETEAIAAIGLVPNISYGSSTTQCSDTVAAGSVISQSATGTVTCGTVVNLVVSLGRQLPRDDFNDNRRGAMWRAYAEQNAGISEDANRLNITADSQIDLVPPCIGHWKMNDDAPNKTVLDSSTAGHNGTAYRNTEDVNTIGKINGALNFNGTSDYVALSPTILGTGSYTKAAWVKLESSTGVTFSHNILSGKPSQAFWAPNWYGNKLSAGHYYPWDQVQDSESLQFGVWYFVAVTYDATTQTLTLYKNGTVADTGSTTTPQPLTELNIGRYDDTATYFKGSIDNVMLFNRALTEGEIAALYNTGSGTEVMPSLASGSSEYAANSWSLDANENFQAKVDFHYSAASSPDGWIAMTIESDSENYVSILAGADGNSPYFEYEQVVDGSVISSAQVPRGSNDGTLYVSYNAASDKLYLSYNGYGDTNAWQTITGLLAGQWSSEPVRIAIGGGSDGGGINNGQAYLDNFEVDSGRVLNWPPANDIDGNGFIELDDLEIMCENWLVSGPNVPGDIHKDEDNIVNFLDFADFALVW